MSCNKKDNKKALKEAQNKLFTHLQEHHRLNSICHNKFLLGKDFTDDQEALEAHLEKMQNDQLNLQDEVCQIYEEEDCYYTEEEMVAISAALCADKPHPYQEKAKQCSEWLKDQKKIKKADDLSFGSQPEEGF